MEGGDQKEVAGRSGEFGDLRRDGLRVTWRDGALDSTGVDSFSGRALFMCFNLSGKAQGGESTNPRVIEPGEMAVGFAPAGRLTLDRVGGGRHQFVTFELRRSWVARWLPGGSETMREPVKEFLDAKGGRRSGCSVFPMSAETGDVARQFFDPPEVAGGLTFWQHGKALEAAAHGLFEREEEFFCNRTKRIAQDRVGRVREALLGNLEYPPPLAELGKLVGCSPFYLSRLFRDETGQTISQFLRGARLARAAELLRGGEGNVTEAAMAVGYSSLSHFSKAFREGVWVLSVPVRSEVRKGNSDHSVFSWGAAARSSRQRDVDRENHKRGEGYSGAASVPESADFRPMCIFVGS